MGDRQKNCIRFELARVDELPFEKNYYIRSEGDLYGAKRSELICWFVQGDEQRLIEERGLPDWLRLNEEAILFLH